MLHHYLPVRLPLIVQRVALPLPQSLASVQRCGARGQCCMPENGIRLRSADKETGPYVAFLVYRPKAPAARLTLPRLPVEGFNSDYSQAGT